MTTIPNELKITINTSIPGFQKITYKPSMSIPDISKDDNVVMFNPLIKLKESTIEKIPENMRIKEFFNKGLFDSLINFHGSQPKKTLDVATKEGIVDNNIKVTLNTILPENSVIYINKKPYVIADVQWTKGDWKIDTKKKKEEYDSSKITDPYLYSAVVKDEIISGEKELGSLSENILYGPNYDGPKDNVILNKTSSLDKGLGLGLATGITKPVASNSSLQDQQILNPPSNQQVQQSTSTPIPIAIANLQKQHTLSIENNSHTSNISQPQPNVETKGIINPTPQITKQPTLTITNNSSKFEDLTNEVNEPIPETILTSNITSTKNIRAYFKNPKYYNFINLLFKNFTPSEQRMITSVYLNTTSINVKLYSNNISESAYTETINGLSIVNNTGEGDCFFIAIADAINYHNYKNQNNKKNRITNGIYGNGNNLFTKNYLRSIVTDYFLNLKDIDHYLEVAEINADQLNDLFKKHIKTIEKTMSENGQTGDIGEDVYINIVNDLYLSSDNFLITKTDKIPVIIDNYYKPYTVVSKSQISKYMNSSYYWANEVAFKAVCEKLNLNVIPIEYQNGQMRIPFMNLMDDCANWNRYVFLLYKNSHYELITFTNIYKKISKQPSISNKLIKDKISIFNKNSNIIPPFYIIFLIFASYYINLDDDSKNKIVLLSQIFNTINISFNNIYKNLNDPLYKNYLTEFIKYFPNSKNKFTTNALQTAGEYPPYYNRGYYNNPYYYNNRGYTPYVENRMIKSEHKSGGPNICYYITIDMELQPGKSLTPGQMSNLKCTRKWNSVRKAYSELTGQKYIIKPVYNQEPINSNNRNINNDKYKTSKRRPNNFNRTRNRKG
uniref:OTU domain-containing protein n=1 Tax=viral metagenome TaxID=1070528 RepID=A0A6C0ERT8_9ZZZZ